MKYILGDSSIIRGTIPQRLGVRSPTADKAVDDQPDVSSISQNNTGGLGGDSSP